jgi:hypothetical protein
MRKIMFVFLALLLCSCEESKYYIHVVNNTEDPARVEAEHAVRYALAKDSGTVHTIGKGGKNVHEVSFGVPHGIEFYEPDTAAGKPRNVGLRYTGDDSYEFYTLPGIPLLVINTLNFDVQLSCGGYLSEDPLTVPGQDNSAPGEKSATIYTLTPNFRAIFTSSDQEHSAPVTFTVKYDDDDNALQMVAEIR